MAALDVIEHIFEFMRRDVQHNIAVHLNEAAVANLDDVIERTGLTTANIFRYGLSLIAVYVEAKESDNQMRIVNPEGGSQGQIELGLFVAKKGKATCARKGKS